MHTVEYSCFNMVLSSDVSSKMTLKGQQIQRITFLFLQQEIHWTLLHHYLCQSSQNTTDKTPHCLVDIIWFLLPELTKLDFDSLLRFQRSRTCILGKGHPVTGCSVLAMLGVISYGSCLLLQKSCKSQMLLSGVGSCRTKYVENLLDMDGNLFYFDNRGEWIYILTIG